MKPVVICPREDAVVAAIVAGGWPASVARELSAHVDSCAACQEVVNVALVMRDEHTAACAEAPLPTAGLVWWRAQLKARQEAARVAGRPMTFVHGVAAVCALAAVLTLAGVLSPRVRDRFGTLVADASSASWSWPDVAAVTAYVERGGMPLLLMAGIWMVLVPIVLYLALSRE